MPATQVRRSTAPARRALAAVAALFAAFTAFTAFTAGAAGAQPVALRPGLWVVSPQGKDPAQQRQTEALRAQMATLPAAQRKAFEASLASQGVGLSADGTVRMCLTKDMLAGNRWIDAQQRRGCTTTPGARSGNTQAFSYRCTQPAATGEGSITIASEKRYRSSITTRSPGQPPVTMQASGAWKSDDCGAVTPLPVRP